jgi:hypothetical protein
MGQAEISRTIVFAAPRHTRAFFGARAAGNLGTGRPGRTEIIFKRSPRGARAGGIFKTAIDRHATAVTLNIFCKHSRIRQDIKDGRALRIETVIHDACDLGRGPLPGNFSELRARARDRNRRILKAGRAGQGCVLANPVFERIAHPAVDAAGRKAPATRFGGFRVRALAGASCRTPGAAAGITSTSLRALMTGLPGTPCPMTQAPCDLARLSRSGLITRRHHASTCDLASDRPNFAIFCTKAHDRVPGPPSAAGQPQAPSRLRAALRAIDQHIDQRLAHSRLPAAA